MTTIDIATTSRLAGEVLDEVNRAVVGKRAELTLLLCGVLAGGHVLLEDLPGLGKTLAARSLAQTLGLKFTRAQFTPDLLPADLTGSFVYDQRTSDFVFRRGPLFTGLLLADEINRTPPKTQAALLEAMQEQQITVEGQTFALDTPFHVLATANPVEYEGTYPLPEAQLDRFLLRISFGYPTPGEEWEVLSRRMERRQESQELRMIVDAPTLLAMQAAVETVTVDDDIGRYCVDLVVATRRHQHVQIGASPRGALGLLLCSRAYAVVAGRGYVTPEDVKAVAPSVLAHRITIKPELWLTQASGASVTAEVLATMPTPSPMERNAVRAPGHWRPTAAHTRAVIGSALFGMVAVLARRPDLLVIATPLVGAAVWATLRRPTRPPDVTQALGHATIREGEATTWRVAVHDAEGRIDEVASVLIAPEWIESTPASGHAVVSLHHDPPGGLDFVIRSTRWGRDRVGPAMIVASSAWAGFRWVGWDDPASRSLLTLPQPSHFDATSPPLHTAGLVGVSRSPRQGSGAEYAGIRPFQPGDRLRRIHWARSLRSGTLHVTSTYADHDRHVVLLVDALTDVGTSEGIDGRASSLDISLRAAGAIAGHYIATGDRLALVLIGARGVQRVPPASGRRQLRRVLEVLANVEPTNDLLDDGRIPPGLGQEALVIMFSPLVSSRTLQRAMSIAQRGLKVLVVDCLPLDITLDDPDDPYVGIAWRIELLQREREVRKVREAGIAVVPWRGPGSLDAVLRDMHRHAGATAGRRR